MAHYLVTGGAGFIGSHLCDALVAKGHTVYVLDDLSSGSLDNLPKDVQCIRGDIRDEALLEHWMAKTQGCFHLAAVVSIQRCNDEPLHAHGVNLTGTLHVLESACRVSLKRGSTVPVVFASSCAVYGDGKIPHQESSPLHPLSLYAVQKAAGEQYGYGMNALHGLAFTALRLFNVYGTRQKSDSMYAGVIPVFLTRLAAEQPCIFYGDGLQSRDFISVKDVAQFFIKAMLTSTQAARTFNVCTGSNTSIQALAELLSKLSSKPLKTQLLPARIGDIKHSLGSPKRASKALGMVAQYALPVGLGQYIEEITR